MNNRKTKNKNKTKKSLRIVCVCVSLASFKHIQIYASTFLVNWTVLYCDAKRFNIIITICPSVDGRTPLLQLFAWMCVELFGWTHDWSLSMRNGTNLLTWQFFTTQNNNKIKKRLRAIANNAQPLRIRNFKWKQNKKTFYFAVAVLLLSSFASIYFWSIWTQW